MDHWHGQDKEFLPSSSRPSQAPLAGDTTSTSLYRCIERKSRSRDSSVGLNLRTVTSTPRMLRITVIKLLHNGHGPSHWPGMASHESFAGLGVWSGHGTVAVGCSEDV